MNKCAFSPQTVYRVVLSKAGYREETSVLRTILETASVFTLFIIQYVAQARGNALEIPDVGDGGGEVDVTHSLAAHLRPSDLDTALLTNDALVAHALVFAARALLVARGIEDLLTE